MPVILNFNMKTLYGWNIEHYSPIVSYNQKEDRFLLIDVAIYMVWVKT